MTKIMAGGEIHSWCTKCRLILNHRIIAMVGSKPARVECSTCASHHNYRATAPGEKAGTGTTRAAAGTKKTRERGPTKAEVAAAERERTWEKSIAGKSPNDFVQYRISESFNEGDLIKHKKFGDGVVVRVLDPRKVEVLFKDDSRTLAQGTIA